MSLRRGAGRFRDRKRREGSEGGDSVTTAMGFATIGLRPTIYFVALEEIAIASALLRGSLVLSGPLAQGVCTLAVCRVSRLCVRPRKRAYGGGRARVCARVCVRGRAGGCVCGCITLIAGRGLAGEHREQRRGR
jgi:hypothetical protein